MVLHILSPSDFFHGPDDLLLHTLLNLQFIHGHLLAPYFFSNQSFHLKDMVTGKAKGYTPKGTGKTGVSSFKSRGHYPDRRRLIDAENNDEIPPLILLSQILDCLLGRKTYGAGGGSDKAGGGFIDHFSAAGQ